MKADILQYGIMAIVLNLVLGIILITANAGTFGSANEDTIGDGLVQWSGNTINTLNQYNASENATQTLQLEEPEDQSQIDLVQSYLNIPRFLNKVAKFSAMTIFAEAYLNTYLQGELNNSPIDEVAKTTLSVIIALTLWGIQFLFLYAIIVMVLGLFGR